MAAFDDRDFTIGKERVHGRFVDDAQLLELVDGEAIHPAAS